jgi:hypothetical protein
MHLQRRSRKPLVGRSVRYAEAAIVLSGSECHVPTDVRGVVERDDEAMRTREELALLALIRVKGSDACVEDELSRASTTSTT